MSKVITKFDPELVRRAVDRIAEPVIQTLTPLGNNVMFEKDFHSVITNDGATIAKLIDSEDPTEDAIIQMVKYGSLATNSAAGDGTSTTILLIKKLVDLGIEQIETGTKPMVLKKMYTDMKNTIIDNAEKLKVDVKPESWYDIALISASGDTSVAADVVSVIETAGQDGMVFLNESKNGTTKITRDSGYNLEEPMFDPVLGNKALGKADYTKPYVFITDKKMYHVEECKEILESGYKSGATTIVIVARDFLGESAGFFISNHLDEKVPLNVLLIKYSTPDNDTTPIYDLATYLNAKLVTEKSGSLKGKLTADHFTLVERVYSHGPKTIFVTADPANPELSLLINDVRNKKEENPNDNVISKRLACLTAGTVNVEIGAPTGPEQRELIFRYEDAINATRAAMRSGYVTGGGCTLYNTTREMDSISREFGTTSIKQIAHNVGVKFEESKYGGDMGLNARTQSYSDLRKDGIIEPYDVFKYSVTNAFSIAIAILTSGYIIVNQIEKNDK